MKRAQIIEYAVFLAILTFLHYAEARLGARAFALAFYFAAIYNRRNVLILSPIFLVSSAIVSPTLDSLIISACPVALALILLFVLYKARVKMRLSVMAAACALATLPRAFLETHTPGEAVATAAGIVVTLAMFFVFVSAGYLVLVKRFRFPLTRGEVASLAACAAVTGLGMGYARVGEFGFYYVVAVYALFVAASAGRGAVLFSGAALAAGVAVSGGAEAAVYTALYALTTSLFPADYAYFGGVAGIALSAVMMLTGVTEAHYLSLVMPAAATVFAIATPKKFKSYVHSLATTDGAYSVTRTVINRNRNALMVKLARLSEGLSEMSGILADDSRVDSLPNSSEIAKEVSERCCTDCLNAKECRTALGGSSTEAVIGELTASAVYSGKASILDASPFLSSRCRKLHGVIAVTNEILSREKHAAELRAGADESRGLLRDQLSSLAEILASLASEIGEPLVYDHPKEKRLKEELNRRLISARDVYIYGDDDLCMSVKEEDAERAALAETVNAVMERKMCLADKTPTVNGLINLTYEPMPRYRVAYGDRVVAAGGDGCGDKENVVRLSRGKVMIVLSDGMGHDAPAARNSRYAVSLIESFYKAGFEHRTVLRSVGGLLALRGKEEFNAVDIAVIDTFTGEVDIIKQGARESFIVRKGEVEVVECGSLPLGIVLGAEPVTYSTRLQPGEFLVMVTDGVADAIGREGLTELLSGLDTVNPDDVAEAVITDFTRLQGDNPERDDGSVIAARIF